MRARRAAGAAAVVLAAGGCESVRSCVSGADTLEGFEGRIEMTVTKPGLPPGTVTYLVRGDRTRVEAAAPGGAFRVPGAVLHDAASQRMWVLLGPPPLCMETDVRPLLDRAAQETAKRPFGRTGRSDTVAGLRCAEWELREAAASYRACVVRGVGFFHAADVVPGGGKGGSWTDRLLREKVFPLRLVEEDASGRETLRAEVTRVDRTAQPASLFEAPSGCIGGK